MLESWRCEISESAGVRLAGAVIGIVKLPIFALHWSIVFHRFPLDVKASEFDMLGALSGRWEIIAAVPALKNLLNDGAADFRGRLGLVMSVASETSVKMVYCRHALKNPSAASMKFPIFDSPQARGITKPTVSAFGSVRSRTKIACPRSHETTS